jgi:hypothetical protein
MSDGIHVEVHGHHTEAKKYSIAIEVHQTPLNVINLEDTKRDKVARYLVERRKLEKNRRQFLKRVDHFSKKSQIFWVAIHTCILFNVFFIL